MKRMKSLLAGLSCVLAIALMAAPLSRAAEDDAVTVGRIYHIEGDLLRYVDEEKDWVAVVPDAPFGEEDTLFSGNYSRAELIVPNGVWIRIGNSTQIQFIRLGADLAEMDLASGTARFSSKGRAVIKVTGDFGYIMAEPETIFDVYAGDNAIEVVSIRGTVHFVHGATGGRYDVIAGAASILADPQKVTLGDGTVDPDWNRWNMERENFWLARENVKGPSAEHLPPQLQDEAYTFEENGRWERVPYEGEERWLWFPTSVAVGWSPFTVGRWTDWYGDPTWIPAEPFGYVTHHYGNWVYVRNRWCWAPPVLGVHIGLPLFDIGFFWYPGRVAWIHSGSHVGWVPLAPRETYYCRRPWGGRHTVIVNNVNIRQININVRNYKHVDHAVVVNRSNFLGRDDYRKVRVTNINRTTIISQYQAAPVVSDRVVKDYSKSRKRFDFTSTPVQEKPHAVVTDRIERNRKVVRESRNDRAPMLEERVKAIPPGRIDRDARIEQPRAANPLVPAREANRPKAEVKLPQREIKGGGRAAAPGGPAQAPGPAEHVVPARPAQSERPTPRTEGAAPARPGQTQPAAPRTERAVPARPAEPAQPAQPARPAERMAPSRPAPPQGTVPGERVTPARPPRPERPAAQTERVIPARPAQPETTAPGTGRAVPGRSAEPAQPARPAEPAVPSKPAPAEERVIPARPAQAEGVAPARPVQPAQPAQPARPAERAVPSRPAPAEERVIPARPAQPERPAPQTERVAPARPVQPAQPARPAERAIPSRPAPSEERIPARPPQTERPAPQTERMTPARPVQPTQPAGPAPAERVAPRPVQTTQPARPAERVAPSRPAQPASQPERAAPARPAPAEPAKPEKEPSPPEPRENRPGRR